MEETPLSLSDVEEVLELTSGEIQIQSLEEARQAE